ncbi:MAG: MarR family winged helix-turn-helix transcriptional regulator [Desulfurococcales archaeon]|nr:MarR family winged helix-turn-helix transcriptional regulator [Desulfurococcales archaeon]
MGICHLSKKAEAVILALGEGEFTRTELAVKAKVAGGTVKRVVDWLIENGFLEEVPVSRYRAVLRPTPKGQELIEAVRKLAELTGDP